MKEIQGAIENSAIKVISVDVFDTLLFRNTKPELHRFKDISKRQAQVVQNMGFPEITAADFYLLRRESARIAYTVRAPVHGAREANWREILSLVFANLGVDPEPTLLAACEAEEIQYESDNLSWNRSLGAQLKRAEESGKQVVCLSDMYLPARVISQLINNVAGHDTGFYVYSSADYGYGKASGKMFERLAKEKDVLFREIVHIGDNYHADYQVPQSIGVNAIHYPRSAGWRLAHRFNQFIFNRSLSSL